MSDLAIEKMIEVHMGAISRAENQGRDWWNKIHDYRNQKDSLEDLGRKTLNTLKRLDQTDDIKLLIYQWKDMLRENAVSGDDTTTPNKPL